MDRSTALAALGALSQDTRLDVFRLLVRTGPAGLPAGDVADRLSVRQNTMSSHLAVLARAGLVQRIKDGRVVRYSADYARMRDLLLYLMEDCCEGHTDICRPVADALSTNC